MATVRNTGSKCSCFLISRGIARGLLVEPVGQRMGKSGLTLHCRLYVSLTSLIITTFFENEAQMLSEESHTFFASFK